MVNFFCWKIQCDLYQSHSWLTDSVLLLLHGYFCQILLDCELTLVFVNFCDPVGSYNEILNVDCLSGAREFGDHETGRVQMPPMFEAKSDEV